MSAPASPLPPAAPVWYVGLSQIAARCRVSKNTLLLRFQKSEVLMFKQKIGVRWAWVTNEHLLLASEMARCRRDWQAQQARQQAGRNGSRVSSTGGLGAR